VGVVGDVLEMWEWDATADNGKPFSAAALTPS
jgi:hypothetical protein